MGEGRDDGDPRPVLKSRLQPNPLDLTLPGFDIDDSPSLAYDENPESCGVCSSTGPHATNPDVVLGSRTGFVGVEDEGKSDTLASKGIHTCEARGVTDEIDGISASLNAITSNISTKKDKSYYYAHQPRDTGGPPAPAPNPDGMRLNTTVAHSVDNTTEENASPGTALNDRSTYYYAHAPRNTSEPAAPEPQADGWVLGRAAADLPTPEETIQKFIFSDEADVVKVYLPLEGIGKKVTKDDVQCTFGQRSLAVVVRGYVEGKQLVFGVPCLYSEIDPSACSCKVLTNKVVLTLTKAPDTPASHRIWRSLR
mmetsp:Transcript_17679/g.38566  ORF Transcript_17679/g.38566 Transcript_17679/m.38566 type:complete len:310 (-) Transcript_17679:17-946(-)